MKTVAVALTAAAVMAGGVAAAPPGPPQYAECVGDVNRQHIRQLIQFETALRGH